MLLSDVQDLYGQLAAAGVVGLVWPVVQAAFDKVEWTPGKRRAVALAAGVGLSVALWYAGGHAEEIAGLLATAGVVVGAIQTGFAALKELGVLDWVGRVTPGGEPRSAEAPAPRHKEGVETPDEDPKTEGFDRDENGEFDVMGAVDGETNLDVFVTGDEGELSTPDEELVEILHARRDDWSESQGTH